MVLPPGAPTRCRYAPLLVGRLGGHEAIFGVVDRNGGGGEDDAVGTTAASAAFEGRREGRAVAVVGERAARGLPAFFARCESEASPYASASSSSSSSEDAEKGSGGGPGFPSFSAGADDGFHAAREAVMVLSQSRRDRLYWAMASRLDDVASAMDCRCNSPSCRRSSSNAARSA